MRLFTLEKEKVLFNAGHFVLLLLLLYFYWSLSFAFFAKLKFSRIHGKLDEFLIITFCAILLVRLFQVKWVVNFKLVERCFLGIVFAVFLSAIFNLVPYKNLPLFLLIICKPFIIYWSIQYFKLEQSILKSVLTFSWVILFINIPFIIKNLVDMGFQFYIKGNHDKVVGLGIFGDAHNLGVLYTFLFLHQYIKFLKKKSVNRAFILLLFLFLIL